MVWLGLEEKAWFCLTWGRGSALRDHFRPTVTHRVLLFQGTPTEALRLPKAKQEPHSPPQQLEEHAAQGEPVGTAVVGCALLQHLGGHVPVGSSAEQTAQKTLITSNIFIGKKQ